MNTCELKGKGPEGGKELYWKNSKKGRVSKGVCAGPGDKHGLDNIVNFYSRNKEYKSRKDEWFQTETKQSKFL